MEHTCMEPIRRGDRRLGSPLDARVDGLVDFLFDRRDRAFAHLVAREPGALHLHGIAADPVALDGCLVAIAPVPVRANADMFQIAATLDVEEGWPAVAMGLF